MKIPLVFLLVIYSGLLTNSFTQDIKKNKISSQLGDSSYTNLNINNISTPFFNNGLSDNSPDGNSGFYFPKGTGKTAVFQTGFLWGTKIAGDPQVKVGGSYYRTGLKGGKIISTGIAEDPRAEHVRIYRVRRDVYPAGPFVDLSSEVNDEEKTAQEIRRQYEKDWMEWRAIDGAPFEDQNSNGIYEPAIDIPGFPGADQTIWFVANDLDSTQTKFLFGQVPLGIELQVTAWSYSTNDYLDNIIFRKYVMINKSTNTFNDTYITMWSDTEIGDAGDDYVGCDTTLGLGYGYNALDKDFTYMPMPPSAVGFKFLKGPKIPNNHTLPITAFYPVFKSSNDYGDPPQQDIEGAVRFYNLMQGKYGFEGKPFVSPINGDTTTFPLSGDPITNRGWIDGLTFSSGFPPGDRRCGIASGPFQMAVGDTQEIIIAEIAAIGNDRYDSIKKLKEYAFTTEDFYNKGLKFNLHPKVPEPHVIIKGTVGKIRLNWEDDISQINFIENFNYQGYKFQGYNIYQISDIAAFKEKVKKIATYDIVDGITTIYQNYVDPKSGITVDSIFQSGTDSGIKRTFSTDYDYIENSHMLIGKEYYFAITAYAYNEDPASVKNNIESPLRNIAATYYNNFPGAAYGDRINSTGSENLDESKIKVIVVDPTKLTGDTYEVFFTERDEIKDEYGFWIPASTIYKTNNSDDLSGSSVQAVALHDENPSQGIKINFTLNLVSPTNSFAEGIRIIFPPNISIINAPSFYLNNNLFTPRKISDRIIEIGYVNNQHTKKKLFKGGETWSIYVNKFVPPAELSWEIYDDGSSISDSLYLNTTGITVIEKIESRERRNAKYWNVRNLANGSLVMENQSIVNGKILYPAKDDNINELDHYPGPVADGFQIEADIRYDVPIRFSSIQINPSSNTPVGDYTENGISIINYYSSISSKVIDNFGVGTSDLNTLKDDYKLIFTGHFNYKTINDLQILYVESGGQLATYIGGISDSAIAKHPFNPIPGLNQPFLLTIPFEIWNKDKNMQVNLIIKDRFLQNYNNSFFSVWDPVNTYKDAIIINSTYQSKTPITLNQSDSINSEATWAFEILSTIYSINDTVTITYPNPIQFGVDKFIFTTPKPVKEIADIDLESYIVYQNYPNPFNPGTKIRYYLPEANTVKIEVFNILGQRVVKLLDEEIESGFHEVNFDGSNLASGIYIYTIEVKDRLFEAKKMLLLK